MRALYTFDGRDASGMPRQGSGRWDSADVPVVVERWFEAGWTMACVTDADLSMNVAGITSHPRTGRRTWHADGRVRGVACQWHGPVADDHFPCAPPVADTRAPVPAGRDAR